MPKKINTKPVIEIDDRVTRRGFLFVGTVTDVVDDKRRVVWDDKEYSSESPKWCHVMELQKC